MNFMLAILAFVWLLASTLFFAAGEFMSKKWGMNPGWFFAFEIIVVYGIGVLLWLPAMVHKNQLAVMGTIWALMGALITIAIGIFIFQEKISLAQTFGVLLAIIALGLLWA